MDEFDLGRLTNHDFEKICKDLFEEILGLPLELFTSGRDGGIDLRYYSAADSCATIIQCKHWMKSGQDKLLSHYRRIEAKKVSTLSPQRYILATSAEFTPGMKGSLEQLLSPHLKSTGDIYGGNEIVSLLRVKPHIVLRHIRLWLGSSTILQGVLTRDVANKSRSLAEDIEEALRTYVPNLSYERAREVLEREHVCVIAGIPGIGKSTLARVLAASYIAEGFEIVNASVELDDIDRVWSDDTKQVFLVDDFLGETVLDERQARIANRSLPRLLKDAQRAEGKRVILTTREYILAHARERHEMLSKDHFDPIKSSINLSDYNLVTKGEILYNHIYFSGLTDDDRAKFVNQAVYLPIVKHVHYSPRIIEHALLQVSRAGDVNVVQALMENLRDPRRIWERLFEDVLHANHIGLVVVVFSLGSRADVPVVERAWRSYSELGDIPETDRIFRRTLRMLQETMLRIVDDNFIRRRNRVAFHNHSVEDYVRQYIAENSPVLRQLFSMAICFEQVKQIWRVASSAAGQRMMASLVQMTEQFEDAVLRLVGDQTKVMGQSVTWIEEAILIIQSASVLRSDRLIELGSNYLAEFENTNDREDVDDLIRLVDAVGSSTIEEHARYLGLVVTEAESTILCEAYGWDGARNAEVNIIRLGSYASSGAADDARMAVAEEAERILSNWVGHEPSVYVDDREIEEVLEWVNSNSDGLHIDGYENALAYIEKHRVIPKIGKPEVVEPIISSRSKRSEIDELAKIFSKLVNSYWKEGC